MQNLDNLIKICSRRVFSRLTESDYRMLKYLAENNSANLTEIGDKTSQYAYGSFDRWGVKARFYESSKSLGLITYDYVYQQKKDKKESRYGLTLKGLLAILKEKPFEKIAIVQRYGDFLKKFSNDKKIICWSMDFIKYEIALILCYNYIMGFDWTRFRFLKYFWDEYKEYDSSIVKRFFQNNILDKFDSYKSIKKEYLKLFYILDGCTTSFLCGLNSPLYEDVVEIDDNSIRKYIDRWYLFISNPDVAKRSLYKKWKKTSTLLTFNQKSWEKEYSAYSKESHKILRKNGFKVNWSFN